MSDTANGPGITRPPTDHLQAIRNEIQHAGGPLPVDPELEGAIGATMFDLPGSQDHTLTVLLPQEMIAQATSQALVRIKSRRDGDGRTYLGMVTAGPFAEPDSLRGDSPLLITVAARGGIYLPPYHGRVQVTILGEELPDGSLTPPRLRPLPNSPVVLLSEEESAQVLKADGDIRLGMAIGHDRVIVGIPSTQKAVLPRHTAILGTTGGGKSTTVARLVQQAQAAGLAVILLDVEGEYTHLHEPTNHPRMLAGLKERNLPVAGIPAEQMTIYHLTGRDTANRSHPNRREFSLQFARLSPYTVMEILDMTDAQQERFLKAYDLGRDLLRELKIFPRNNNADDERLAIEIDEFERGYPRMSLPLLIDIVGTCLMRIDKSATTGKGSKSEDNDDSTDWKPQCRYFQNSDGAKALRRRVRSAQLPSSVPSWRALLGKLSRLNRLKVFGDEASDVKPLIYKQLLKPGQVSIIDLSDTGASELNNLVIADLLAGVQDAQEDNYVAYEKAIATGRSETPPPRVLVIIEEAHEFLSAERIERTKLLFEQVARIAKRGRKRWLGLTFVTQLPQHLPRQLFGLVNSYILHKITDPQVVQTLRRTVSGIDEGLWERLTGLAPGQAIVSFPHMTRPLLVSIDPTPARLRLID